MSKLLIFLGLFSLLSLNSCLVSRKIVYFKDMDVDSSYLISPVPPITIQKNDRISIRVGARNPELAVPFNSTNGIYEVTGLNEDDFTESKLLEKGYLVDEEGYINFPILGKISVEGKSLEEISIDIKNQLTIGNYISNPSVNVELLNMKVIVVGEAANRVLRSETGRFTLVEVIALVRGIGSNVATDKITVFREENGLRKKYQANIEDKEFFNSPIYHLKQNDLVYFEPKASVPRGDETRTWRIWGMITSTIGIVGTILAITSNK